MNYFNKLPVIEYNGYTVKNIIARATLSEPTKNNKLLFYPYTIKEGERSDLLSYYYYEDPGYSWLIWMTNNIIDPYYDMPLSQDDLEKTIISKYGSQERAMRKIKCYRNNWYQDLEIKTQDFFNNLAPQFKKYYDPVVDSNYQVTGYKRKRHDDIVNTNRTITMTLDNSYTFTIGEEIRYDSNNYAFITNVQSKAITVHNVVGAFSTNNIIVSQESNLTAQVVSVDVDSKTIAFDESTYWNAVSYHDYETELNEAKKEIQLMDARYKSNAEEQLKNLMNVG